LKSFHDFTPGRKWWIAAATVLLSTAGFVLGAKGDLPIWIRNVEAKTGLERAFFRSMQLPYGEVLFRRPPAETRPALGELVQQQPTDANLYALRALEAEQQLDLWLQRMTGNSASRKLKKKFLHSGTLRILSTPAAPTRRNRRLAGHR